MRIARRTTRGFTLIELLVVIIIILVIAGLALHMVMRSLRSGSQMRQKADLNTIAIALDAYRTDYGDYPRVATKDTGAAVLGKALVGPFGDGILPGGGNDPDDPPMFSSSKDYRPGDCVMSGANLYVCIVTTTIGSAETPPNPEYWAPFNPRDGFDGPGFRSRVGGGKVSQAYLKPENFNMVGVALCDRDGEPILYFPATPGGPNVNKDYGYVDTRSIRPTERSLYNAEDNLTIFRRAGETDDENALTRIRAVFGDFSGFNGNGSIDSQYGPETALANSAFVLWSSGPDGAFGPNTVKSNVSSAADWKDNQRAAEKCDDVTNFR